MSKINEYGMNYYNNRTKENFNILYREVHNTLLKYLYTKVYSDEDKLLIIDKTLENIWVKIDKYNPKYKFSTFVYVLCMNQVNGYYKSFTRLRVVFSDNCDWWEQTESIDKEKEHKQYRMIVDKIKELPEPHRTYVMEKFIYGKELKEIAKEYNVSLSHVKHHIYHSLKRIKKECNE